MSDQDRTYQHHPLPPRRHEPICFKPMASPDQRDDFHLLDIVVAILASWIIIALVIYFASQGAGA